jgi:hypothetical protein
VPPRGITQNFLYGVSQAQLQVELKAWGDSILARALAGQRQEIDALAQSLNRSLNPIVQNVNNIVNNTVVNNTGGSFDFSEIVNGLEYSGGVLSTTAGYEIPLSASTTGWNAFYNAPSSRIIAGANCAWVSNTFNCVSASGSATTTINGANGPTFTFNAGSSGTDFSIATSAGTVIFNIPTSSASVRGLLAVTDFLRIPLTASSTNWNSFYNTPSTRVTAGANLAWVGNTLGFSGILPIASGGTGTTTAPTYGQLLMGNIAGSYDLVSTSSLGFGSGTVGSGTTGQTSYYAANGTTLSATSTVFIATNGNVGIGTTTPSYKLDLGYTNSGANVPGLYIHNDAAASGIEAAMWIASPNSQHASDRNWGFVINHTGNGYFEILNSASASTNPSVTRLTINSAGQVGVGSAPIAGQQMTILGDASSDGDGALYVKGDASSGNYSAQLQVGSRTGYTPSRIEFVDGSGAGTAMLESNRGDGVSSGTGGYLALKTGATGGTAPSERMRITSAGLIGIGTTTPNNKLDIYSTTKSAIGFSGAAGSTYKWTIGMDVSNGGRFSIASSTALGTTDRFVIDGNGNVGINTASPLGSGSTTLHVAGPAAGSGTQYGSLTLSNTGNTDDVLGAIDFYAGNTSQASIRTVVVSPGSSADLYFMTRGSGTFSEKMRLTNAGNLGVGTSSPASKLDVWGNLRVGTSSTPILMVDTATGLVGIGTSSPAYQLHIRKDQNAGTVLMVQNNTSGTAAFAQTMMNTPSDSLQVGITSAGYTVTGGAELFGQNTAYMVGSAAGGVNMVASNASGVIRFGTGGYATANERMRIDQNGLVGIGTSSPAYQLHIRKDQNAGTALMVQNNTSGSAAFAQLMINTPSDSLQVGVGSAAYTPSGGAELFGQNTVWMIGSPAGGVNLVASNASGVIRFGTGGYAAGNERMKITSSGDVGIGTTSPYAKLSVVGQVVGQYFTATSTTATSTFAGGLVAASSLYVLQGGNVGIGTTTPTGKFVVQGPTNSSSGGGLTTVTLLAGNGSGVSASNGHNVLIQAGNGSTGGSTGGNGGFLEFYGGTGGDTVTDGSGGNIYIAPGNSSSGTKGHTLLGIMRDGSVVGNVGIGTSTPGQKLTVVGNAQFTGVTSGTYASDLNITADGTLTTSASDIRLKENILELATSTLDKLMQLKAYNFTWKTDPDHRQDLGLIAQEVEFIFPELVFTNRTDGFKGVNYSRLAVLLLKGIQDQQIRLDDLKKYTTVLNLKELHTEKLCVGSADDEVCMTKDDVRRLLNGNSSPAPTGNNNGGGGVTTPTEPVIEEPAPEQTPPTEPTVEENVEPPALVVDPVEVPIESPPETLAPTE